MNQEKTQNLLGQVLQSSANPKKLSMTVKNVLLGLIPVFMAVLKAYGLDGIDQQLLKQIIDGIATTVQAGAAFVSSIGVLYGLVRKIWNR